MKTRIFSKYMIQWQLITATFEFMYKATSVFYALKHPKFTTITFCQSTLRPNPVLTSPNCTLDRMCILTIFSFTSLTWQ